MTATTLDRIRCTGCGEESHADGRCARCGSVCLVAEPWVNAHGLPATPLLRSRIPGLEGLRLKVEGANLSGSFKDRVMRALVDDAVRRGVAGAVVASSGNAAIAAATACARAGLPLIVLVPESVSPASIRMVELRGATVVRGGEGPAEVHRRAAVLAAQWPLVNLASTFAAPGCEWACRGIGHEIAFQTDETVTRIAAAISVGPVLIGAGRGLVEAGRAQPALIGAQATGCGPIAAADVAGVEEVTPWTAPAETAALAIADRLTGYAHEATYSLGQVRASGGFVGAVDDARMDEMRHQLARHDGLDVELASCAAPALLLERSIDPAGTVCILTGSGIKETLSATTTTVSQSIADFGVRARLDNRFAHEVQAWMS